uniref:M20_dimer domain-containing protein n=1 Tax=Haemonchus placei TaxID=6290 RepID=A0A0N4WL47_HAEPC
LTVNVSIDAKSYGLGAIDERQNEFVATLKEAVAIPSVSGDPAHRPDCVKMVMWAKKKTVLVYGHLDVQPAAKEDGWHTNPFELTEVNGKLFGRGSTDDKGPVLAWINAISVLQKKNVEIPVNLKFVFECMEESGSEGLEEALRKHKDQFLKNVDMTCISDNYWLGKNKPCLTYGLRGLCYYCIEVRCAKQDLHSGTYGGSIPEAMNDLTEAERKVYEKIDFNMEGSDIAAHGLLKSTKHEILINRWRNPSLSLHGIEGAFSSPGAKTVIPCKVIGKFSIRIVPNMTPKAVDKLVITHLNSLWAKRHSPNHFNVYPHHSGMPWITDYKHKNFVAGASAMKRVFGVEPDYTREGGSIPITLTFQELTGNNVMLLPIGACDDMAHSQNEKLDRTNYIKGTKTLAAYLLELAE